MHESLKKFAPYVEKGLLRQVISPCGRLVLFNYTDHCTYEKAWDDVTLNARGTVYELETGKIVARAFPKFFNFGELQTERQKEILKEQEFEVYEKMDGSLGIIYFYDGEWRVNTRGSFTSDQAIVAKKMLDTSTLHYLNKDLTYLAEIIYPANQIIVDYGDKWGMTMLAVYKTLDINITVEIDLDIIKKQVSCTALFDTAPKYKFNSIDELQAHLETLDHTEEGYVVRLKDGYRVKFKSAEYLKVARIMNHMTPLAFWRAMENGKVKSEYLEHLPEEFRVEADKLVEEMETKYSDYKQFLIDEYKYVIESIGGLSKTDPSGVRKRIALLCKEESLTLGAMFAILDGKSDVLEKIVMSKIKPKGNVL